MIEVKNLSYTYPDGRVALKNISFVVSENENLGIIGPTGAGKTTLLLCLCRLLDFSGEIRNFGKFLTKQNAKEIRKDIGFVFQNPDDQIFVPKVFDEVSFGLRQNGNYTEEEIKDKVSEVLSRVGLSGFEERFVHHLSYGEKKKVTLASAIVSQPKILILDEPTDGLDPASKREFLELVKRIGCIKIVAGHDLGFIKEVCNQILLLNGGVKIEEGPTEKILECKTLLYENRLA